MTDLGIEQHFKALRSFLLMEDGEFGESLSDQLFEKVHHVKFGLDQQKDSTV